MNAVRITLGDPTLHGPEAFDNTMGEIAATERYIDGHRDHFLKATRADDIDRARGEGRLALMVLFQNTTPIGDDLDRLDFFNNLGVRSMQLTYNTRNLVGDGCMERTSSGLSELNHPRRMEIVRRALEERGDKTDHIEKIMGQNFYRIIREVNG
jgi:membrane dipeptidase